jgi:ferredoxin
MRHVTEDIVPGAVRTTELGVSVGRLETALTSNIDRLTLVCQAIWSLVEESTDLTREDLESRIQELEAADEELLAQIEDARQTCPRCKAAIPANMTKCQFCGTEL